MRSIRFRIIVLTLAAVLISVLSFGIIGNYFVNIESSKMSAEVLSLTCENRKDALDEYLISVQQSVNMIARYADDTLDSTALANGGVLGASGGGVEEIPGRSDAQRQELDRYLDEHLAFIESAFKSVANHTSGVSSCYYRINPEITSSPKGFFFTKNGASDFRKVELTKIENYAPDDMNHVGWYYVPLKQGRPSWVGPYYNANLDDFIISYVVPIYKAGTFIGVIGMDIEYSTLVTQIQQFTNFETGYFALTNGYGTILYHPEYKMGTQLKNVLPQVDAIVDMTQDSATQQVNRYEKNGTEWQITYTTLVNGMKLFAAVQESEVNTPANNLSQVFLITGVLILLVFTVLTMVIMRRVTIPLEKLTVAAKRLATGDYDVELDYTGNDEVGVLTSTFGSMRDRLKASFDDLSSKAYTDDLTGVKSKHAFVEAEERLDRLIDEGSAGEFAVVLFDLNDLKSTNDSLGHEAGDRYIKEASKIICSRFKHSPVYRIGGDEFVAILEGEDYARRDELVEAFGKQMDENRRQGEVTIASGLACFDPSSDKDFSVVLDRADEKMYERKKQMK